MFTFIGCNEDFGFIFMMKFLEFSLQRYWASVYFVMICKLVLMKMETDVEMWHVFPAATSMLLNSSIIGIVGTLVYESQSRTLKPSSSTTGYPLLVTQATIPVSRSAGEPCSSWLCVQNKPTHCNHLFMEITVMEICMYLLGRVFFFSNFLSS